MSKTNIHYMAKHKQEHRDKVDACLQSQKDTHLQYLKGRLDWTHHPSGYKEGMPQDSGVMNFPGCPNR